MVNGIILNVNLVGRLGDVVIKEEEVHVRHGEALLTKKISYKGRIETKCVRKTNISGEVVASWIGSKPPYNVKDFIWKKMSKPQRLRAYLERFDEGQGFSYQEL